MPERRERVGKVLCFIYLEVGDRDANPRRTVKPVALAGTHRPPLNEQLPNRSRLVGGRQPDAEP